MRSVAKASRSLPIPSIEIDRDLDEPLQQQIYEAIRCAILDGRLRPGARLPSSRDLAADLGVSRNTVTMAFAMLGSEGYLESRVGSGTMVSTALPEGLSRTTGDARIQSIVAMSEQARLLRGAATDVSRGAPGPFSPGIPPIDLFPFRIWNQLLARYWSRSPVEYYGYDDDAGHGPLREAIASHVTLSRGVRCDPDQVIVVSGAQQGIDLAARVLIDPGDAVWMEDPGYPGARAVFQGARAEVAAVPVEASGLDVAVAMGIEPRAHVAYVTPSHQYPTGVTMSLPNRLALLDWAKTRGSWIIEDDYDSEYRYASRPLSSLQGLDDAGRVIYVGTMNKVLVPAMRVGFVIPPRDLLAPFREARIVAGRATSSVVQAALADFIRDGHLGRHIRKLRKLLYERMETLRAEINAQLRGVLEVECPDAGMHLVGWLHPGVNDRAASDRVRRMGIDAPALSSYAVRGLPRGGLVLGYGAVAPSVIPDAVTRLAAAIRGS